MYIPGLIPWNFAELAEAVATAFNSVVTAPILTALLLGKLFSDMVRVVNCHTGVLGSIPGEPKSFFALELLYHRLDYNTVMLWLSIFFYHGIYKGIIGELP